MTMLQIVVTSASCLIESFAIHISTGVIRIVLLDRVLGSIWGLGRVEIILKLVIDHIESGSVCAKFILIL